MTLGENKKITLGLIEEYSKDNNNLTEDLDIADRINFIYATNYQKLSEKKKIIKTFDITKTNNSNNYYRKYDLPADMYELKEIIILDPETNIPTNGDYRLEAEQYIYINDNSDLLYRIVYASYPKLIEEDTPDIFELEIGLDAQAVLPYAVANDILKTDPSADYTAFYREYQERMSGLKETKQDINIQTVNEYGI